MNKTRLAILKRLKAGTEYSDLGDEIYPTLTRRETDEIMKEAGEFVEVLLVEAECDKGYEELMRAEISRLKKALEPFALIYLEGVSKREGYCTVTTQADYFCNAAEVLKDKIND